MFWTRISPNADPDPAIFLNGDPDSAPGIAIIG
jgi:hypothetical protein